MEGAAVQKIAELEDKNKTIEVGNRVFARSNFMPVIYNPRPSALQGSTLSGLVDYITANVEAIDPNSCMLHVVDFNRVELVKAYDGEDLKRTEYFHAVLDSELPVFKFDSFMPVEDFIIKARALFEPTTDMDAIIAIVSKLVSQNEITADDNGISQSVQVKKGVSGALSTETQTKGVYELRPYRTFRDLEQPSSRFILRLQPVEGALPKVALFDADGGSWRYHATQAIKAFLVNKKLGIPVLA